MAKHSQS
jgi:hypothetical protein